MKKKKNIFSFIFLILSMTASFIGSIFIYDNFANNIDIYLDRLVDNKFDSYIFYSTNGDKIADNEIPSQFSISQENQIGLISEELSFSFEGIKGNCSLVKSKPYENDFSFNNFNVYAFTNQNFKTSWRNLKNNNVFIAYEFALQLIKNSQIEIGNLIGKEIKIENEVFLVGGVYYTNSNADDPINASTKGNIFCGTNKNVFFINSDTETNLEYNPFLFFLKSSKIKKKSIFDYFYKLLKNTNRSLLVYDNVYDTLIDHNIEFKIEEVKTYTKKTANVFIGLTLLFLSLLFFILSMTFLYKKYKNKSFKKMSFIFEVIIYFIFIYITKYFYIKTPSGIPLLGQNSCSISFFFIFGILYFSASYFCIFLNSKNRDKDTCEEDGSEEYFLLDV